MRIQIFANPKAAYQNRFAQAFQEGLSVHGIEAPIRDHNEVPQCDLAVMWAHKKQQIIQTQRAKNRDYLVMENPYIGPRDANELEQISLGFNGLNGRAEFVIPEERNGRAEPWHDLLQDWTDGEYWLIMGQVSTDASVSELVDIGQWATQVAESISEPVFVRHHPKGAMHNCHVQALQGDLDECLAGAHAVVTFNSNSAIDALLAGRRVVVYDQGSMAYGMGPQDVKWPLMTPDREPWLDTLAYCQWSESEIRTGEYWELARARYG